MDLDGLSAHDARRRALRAATRRRYDSLSRYYDALTGFGEAALTRDAVARLALSPGETVLEIGSGTGKALVLLAAAVGPAGQAVGLDLSWGMLAIAHRRQMAGPASDRVDLVCGDGTLLPFRSEAFDAVFLSFTLELFDGVGRAVLLDECRRVVKPTGRVGVVSLLDADRDGLVARTYRQARRLLPDLIDCRPIEVRSELEAAGWRPLVERTAQLWGLPVATLVGTPAELPED